MKKKIGIIFWESLKWQRRQLEVRKGFFEQVERMGALPLGFPALSEDEVQNEFLDYIDGLILTGDKDVSPFVYGQEAVKGTGDISLTDDKNEISVIRKVLDKNIPLLAVDRPMLLTNVLFGGDLYQDLESQVSNSLVHFINDENSKIKNFHTISVDVDSHLYKAVGETLIVNSNHHQAVNKIGKGLKVVARSKDGLVEALEKEEGSFFMGLQFNPEMIDENEKYLDIFKYFVEIIG